MTSRVSWFLERSDGGVIEIDKPSIPVVFGRGRTLPSVQRIESKYVSRHQFSVELRPPSLFVKQIGKNPTFYSADFHPLPPAGSAVKELECRSCEEKEDNGKGKENIDGKENNVNIIFVPCESKESCLALGRGRNGRVVEASTLHFPGELGLPFFTVRCVAPASKGKEKEAAQVAMPIVPLACPDSDNDDDEGRGTKNGKAGGWRGILDSVLREQQQQQQEE